MARKRRKKKKQQKSHMTKIQFTKVLIMVNNYVGLFLLFLSYILAFMDKVEIAQELSTTICREMCAVTLFYCCKSYFETNAEKKHELEEKKLETYEIENERGD